MSDSITLYRTVVISQADKMNNSNHRSYTKRLRTESNTPQIYETCGKLIPLWITRPMITNFLKPKIPHNAAIVNIILRDYDSKFRFFKIIINSQRIIGSTIRARQTRRS